MSVQITVDDKMIIILAKVQPVEVFNFQGEMFKLEIVGLGWQWVLENLSLSRMIYIKKNKL